MITMNEIVKSGFDIGEACKECIHCYGHNNCCEEEEDECSQFDEVRSDYIDFLYSKVTYKQIDDMKHAIGFDNRKVRGTKYRRYEPYRGTISMPAAEMLRTGSSLFLLGLPQRVRRIGIMCLMTGDCS